MRRSISNLRLIGPILLAAFLQPVPTVAQVADDERDRHIDVPDNPTGRAEYERLKRADPATGRIPEGMRARELEFVSTIPSRESLVERAEKNGAELSGVVVRWHERGPVNQGGRTRALAIDRTNEGVLIAGGVSGGLWRSENTGSVWVRVTAIDQIHSVTCLTQDPRPGAANVWYYGTGEWRANSANLPGDGIFKSIDGGRTWSRLASTVRNTPQSRDQVFDYVHRIVVDPSNRDQDEVYAACYGGIARSTDGGESWQEVLGNLGNSAPYTDVAITSGGVLYATLSSNGRTRRGIWRSEDGTNWTQITPPDFPTSYGKISIGIAPSKESIVYFFGETPNAGRNDHSLWVYEHGGAGPSTWENRSAALPANVETYSSYCLVIRVRPDDENVVFLGHVNLIRSMDGFRDSANVTLQMGSGQHADQHEIVFFPSNPDRTIAGHDGGLSMTLNNVAPKIQWESLNSGYVTTQFYSVAIDHAVPGSWMTIGGTQDNGTWFINNGNDLTEWKKVFGADGGFCAIADSGTNFYMSYQSGQIHRNVLDGDGKSSGSVRVDPEGGDDYLFIHPFALDPSDTRIMYLPEGRRMWRNSDLTGIPLNGGGAKKSTNWTRVDSAAVPSNAGVITAVGVSRNSPSHRLYYGTATGRIYRLDNADTTFARGIEITRNAFPNGYVSCIAVDPTDGDRALVAISSYNTHSLFYTTDAGETWDTVGGNLEERPDGQGSGPSVGWAAILPVEEHRVYLAGTTAGLYSTTSLNGANTFWALEGASTIGNVVIDMIDARESDGFVAAGSHGRGIFTGHVLPDFLQASVSVSPSMLDFGKVEVGSKARDTLTIANDAASSRGVQVAVPALAGAFSVADGAGSALLAPGASHRVIVDFAPDSATLYSEALSIAHDGTSPATPSSVLLSGEGIASTGAADEEIVSGDLTLEGYPNPFSKNLELRFRLTKGAHVQLTVVTADGAEVATLIDRRMEEGEHTAIWTPANVANGRYFVRLQAGARRVTVPVMLER